jgi:succinate dehydrogenase / fumarate reductase cytochrome b subunit
MHKKIRPLSPHITIYKPQISSVLSIAHRITGVINFAGMSILIWWVIIIGAYGFIPENTFMWQFFQSYIGIFCLMAWSFSLLIHMCTGIRHLFWDIGYGFSLKVFPKTGWVAVLSALVFWAILWITIFFS